MQSSSESYSHPAVLRSPPSLPATTVLHQLSSMPYLRGAEAIYRHCCMTYGDINPKQITTRVKYWMGGSDPLDHILMYENSTDGIPPHWHYVSMGLSDLHGDERVHPIPRTRLIMLDKYDGPSGLGMELTFRLVKGKDETSPPTWPAAVMQAFARQIFSTTRWVPGDFMFCSMPLDGQSESRVQHVLIVVDPQLGSIKTPFGLVEFRQIVGITKEELDAVQKWNGLGVADLLKSHPTSGGHWLVTDLRRGESIFELNPWTAEDLEHGITEQGSNLSGMNTRCLWEQWTPPIISEFGDDHEDEDSVFESVSVVSERRRSAAAAKENDRPGDSMTALPGAEITLCQEAALRLPLMLKGRLSHGKHFSFNCMSGMRSVTFLTEDCGSAFVSAEQPIGYVKNHLEVMIPSCQIGRLQNDMEFWELVEATDRRPTLPKVHIYHDLKFKINVVGDGELG